MLSPAKDPLTGTKAGLNRKLSHLRLLMSLMDERLAALSSTQFGLITRDQAFSAGLSKSAIGRRLECGAWTRIHPGVYALPGSVDSWERKLKAAQLWVPEAVLSHRSAGALLELDGITDRLVELTWIGKPAQHQQRGVIFHSTDYLPKKHVRKVKGFWATTATRTLLDLGAVVSPTVVEAAGDDALRRALTAIPLLQEILQEAGKSGRSGTAALRAFVADRPIGERPTDSQFETRLFRVLRAARLPRPVKQFVVRDVNGRFVARPDFAITEHLIAIEAHSYRYHMGRKPFLNDIRKHNALTGLGWRILIVTWDDLVRRPHWVVAQLRARLEAA